MTDLAERYGTRNRLRRPLVATVVVLVAAAGLGWLAWASWFHGTPEVRSGLEGYDVVSPHLATATVTVVRASEGTEASCRVRAVAADHAVVGDLTFTVDSGPRSQRVRPEVRTEREATTVELVGCVAPGQRNPR